MAYVSSVVVLLFFLLNYPACRIFILSCVVTRFVAFFLYWQAKFFTSSSLCLLLSASSLTFAVGSCQRFSSDSGFSSLVVPPQLGCFLASAPVRFTSAASGFLWSPVQQAFCHFDDHDFDLKNSCSNFIFLFLLVVLFFHFWFSQLFCFCWCEYLFSSSGDSSPC